MRVMYTHNEAKNMTRGKLIKQIILMAGRCNKVVKEESLQKYDDNKLYDKYLSYRNKYILFYKGAR